MRHNMTSVFLLLLTSMVVIFSFESISASDAELIVDAGPDKAFKVGVTNLFSDTTIISPDPLDPNRTYTFSWDFDDKVDLDSDGIFNNDNETTGQFPEKVFYDPGYFVATCTLTDGFRIAKDTINFSIGRVWIASLTSEKQIYNTSETPEIEVQVERGGDPYMMTLSVDLIVEVFDENEIRIFNHTYKTTLNSGGNVQLLTYSLMVGIIGTYKVRATILEAPWVTEDVVEIPIHIIKRENPISPVAIIAGYDPSIFLGEELRINAIDSYDEDGWIVSYSWDFGDGLTGSELEISHLYDNLGPYEVTLEISDNDGMSSNASIQILVKSHGSPASPSEKEKIPFLPLISVLLISSFVLVSCTEIGKISFISLLLPLYMKMNKEEVLDQFTRGKIFGFIIAYPGEHYNSIRKTLAIPNGSFVYHLNILEKEGHIKSSQDGIYKRYYPSDMRIPDRGTTLNHSQTLIIDTIKETPGISQKDIASILDVSSSTVNYHMDDLIRMGLVRKERAGMRLRYYIDSEERDSNA